MTNDFLGLLAQHNPALLDIGMGLLSQSGPVVGGPAPSLGQAFGHAGQFAMQRGQQRMENNALRDQLRQQARQREAMTELQALLTPGQTLGPIRAPTPAAISTPQGQQQAMGLLSEAAPEQFLAQTFNQVFPGQENDTTLVRNLKAAGIDPLSAEGVGIIRQNLTGQTNELDATLKNLQIQSILEDREAARNESERNQATARLSVISGTERLLEVAAANERLRGTMGETGLGFNELRAAAAGPFSALSGLFGGNEQRARQVAADIQRMNQLTTTEAVQSLFEGENSVGTVTDAKLGTFLTTKPGLDKLPEVNAQIIADMLQSKLDSADVLSISLPDRELIEQQIDQLRGAGSSAGGSSDSGLTAEEQAELERLRAKYGRR